MASTGRNLCLAGGLGLNALLVSALESRSGYQNVFVQPVSGNAGTAIGAVLDTWHGAYRQEQRVALTTLCLGPSYPAPEIKQVLENCKLQFRYMLTADEVVDAAVAQLNDNKIVAWMHGRMEFGARALGNRSILASPLDPYSTENLNAFIKHREPYRKFAASVPAELSAQYFEVGANARYLSTVGRVRPEHRDRFAGAILAGDRIRVHTVDRDENPLYWKLLQAAGKSTGLPVLYNTSFNLFVGASGVHPARRRAKFLFLWHRRHVRRQLLPAEVGALQPKISSTVRTPVPNSGQRYALPARQKGSGAILVNLP